MPFDWKSLVDLAGVWAKQASGPGSHDALLRSALSRTLLPRSQLCPRLAGLSPKENADDHGRLRAHLKTKKRMADSDRLDRLRLWRNDSDYLDELAINLPGTVQTALNVAAKTFSSLVAPKEP